MFSFIRRRVNNLKINDRIKIGSIYYRIVSIEDNDILFHVVCEAVFDRYINSVYDCELDFYGTDEVDLVPSTFEKMLD